MYRKLIWISLLPMFLLLALAGPENRGIEKNAIRGRLIIQFHDHADHAKLAGQLEEKYTQDGLHMIKCLSSSMGIWLASCDTALRTDQQLIRKVKKEVSVANIQFDHQVVLREVIPDDPEFENQWALKNTGQFDGVPDADIDATDAWDITVNTGTNALGDTIVMAIVDDGFSLSHEDMNYWKNRAEVPNNSIDDDNNGYIDDYDGWNAYYSSGYIQPKDHGQHVAGIAGAKGNNGIGVCGVNWNGKVMTVAGASPQESIVIEAYGYVYAMRALYDESNGEKGAFVVVTNSSFGVDFGKPEDYPIWGAMYDSLGSLGILNVGATINGPWDVDEAGDIPTTFPSDHLIGVTNTTYDDEKNLGAGWGSVSIDLGAPGKSIISTRLVNTYGYKTGTSMSAPQVTGSIGLMYAAADEAFTQRYHEAPDTIAYFVKQLLMDAVDILPGFDTLCVSGGRLNVNNALQLLVNPRMMMDADTIFMMLDPDSTGTDTLTIHNLLGFELPYTLDIPVLTEWISYEGHSGTLPGAGTTSLILNFDASGLEEGLYSTEMVFTDIAGMTVRLPVMLRVKSSDGVNEAGNGIFSSIDLYPNPFTDQVVVEVRTTVPAAFTVKIYALDGQQVKNLHTVSKADKESLIRWDGRDDSGRTLPAGIYIVSISDGKSAFSKRLIKIQ